METEGSHNFKQLKAHILPLSVASEWDVAKLEWDLVNIYEASERETCPCGHSPIIQICVIRNNFNANKTEVGNVCVNNFLGLNSKIIFDGVNRIRKDKSKALNEAATVFFHQQGVLSTWEYGFQNDTLRKRNLSAPRMTKRREINEKVLRHVATRGLGS